MTYFFDHIFSGAATLLSVVTILAVYFQQKLDEKTRAAQIILSEIQNAETELRKIENGEINEMTFILPTNSWEKFQHLFSYNFNQDELSQINHFYKSCYTIDKNVRIILNNDLINNQAKAGAIQQALLDLAMQYRNDIDTYETEKRKVLTISNKEGFCFTPNIYQNRAKKYLPTIKYITTSTCGPKLKKLAKQSA